LLKRRLAVTIVAIALVLACAGCGKTETWIFDFATASETEDWVHEEYDDGSATLVTDMGLKLDNHSVCSPVAFTGDFTVTVDLFLDTDASNCAYFECYICDGQFWEPDNMIFSCFENIGTDDDGESLMVTDEGPDRRTEVAGGFGPIPNIVRKGDNVWKLSKTGDYYVISLNGYRIAKFVSKECRSDKYYIGLYGYSYGGDVWFKKVKVDYKGSMI